MKIKITDPKEIKRICEALEGQIAKARRASQAKSQTGGTEEVEQDLAAYDLATLKVLVQGCKLGDEVTLTAEEASLVYLAMHGMMP